MPLEQDGFHTLSSASIYSGNLELLYILGRCWPWLLGNERVLERHHENSGNINSTNAQSNDASANANDSTTSNTLLLVCMSFDQFVSLFSVDLTF